LAQFKALKTSRLRGIKLPTGLGSVEELHNELQNMIDVLLDRARTPVDNNDPLALMKIANAYYARAMEIAFLIHTLERKGIVKRTPRVTDMTKADPYYIFRTGELDTFIKLAERSIDEGSRRLSAVQLEHNRHVRGLEV
jgi:hypothetical protein